MFSNKCLVAAAVALFSSTSTVALAQETAVIIAAQANGGIADGLKSRLEAAGYVVTYKAASDADLLPSLGSYDQVWDVRYDAALSTDQSTSFLSYLNNAGGLFLLGENANFAIRNNSLATFISAAGGGNVAYSATTVLSQYVTDIFNGAAVIAPDSSTAFTVPAAGTVSSPGAGVFITTTGPAGTGNGTGVAFGAGSLSNAPTGRLLTYFDVNTFQASYWNTNPALRNLVDRMIGFVAGSFQADPNLPPVGGPTIIDASQPSFDLSDSAAQGAAVTFDGGTLKITGGADPNNIIAADILIEDDGGFIDTNATSATLGGTVSGAGGLIVEGGGALAMTGVNTYAGGTVVTGGSTLKISQSSALGTGGLSLMAGALALSADANVTNSLQLMAGANGIDTGAHSVSLTSPVSGAGGFTKLGSGTLTLTGANTYTGATTINLGTLILKDSTVGGPVVNNAALIIDNATSNTIAQAISGSGGLTKIGAGTLTLSGANTYTGATNINTGTLVLKDSAVGGPVVNNAALVFDNATTKTIIQTISGTGGLTKTGVGTLILDGQHSYAGGTAINQGILVINSGSIVGPIVNNAGLVFNQINDAAFSSTISGAGSIIKTGVGRTNLTGVSDFSGSVLVDQGTLSVNGSLALSSVVVQGGRVGGNGAVGGLIVRTNAIAAPGNSIGQLTAATTVLFEPGSIYEVEVAADGTGDRINATGAATLQGGTVSVLAEAGDYNPRTRYTILSAGSVAGAFQGVTSNLAFLTPSLSYSNTAVTLTLQRNDLSFASVARTSNQRNAGGALDRAFAASTPVYDQLVGLSADEARSAFDMVSGEIHASALSVASTDADILRRSILERTRQGVGAWGQVLGVWSDLDADSNAADATTQSSGLVFGVDTLVGQTRIGGILGYTNGEATVTDRNSEADMSSIHLAAYGARDSGPINMTVGVSAADLRIETDRGASVGAISQRLTSAYNGLATQAFLEASYAMKAGPANLEPFVGVNGQWLNNDAFAEAGGSLALEGGDRHRNAAWSTLGVKADFNPDGALPQVQLKAGWQHALTGELLDARLAFATGGSVFTVQGVPRAKDAAVIDLNLGWTVGGKLDLRVGYAGLLANQSQSHSGKISLSMPL